MIDTETYDCELAAKQWREKHPTPRLAAVKVYFDADEFARESGEPFNDQWLAWVAQAIQEQVTYIYGYSGWEAGWVDFPGAINETAHDR